MGDSLYIVVSSIVHKLYPSYDRLFPGVILSGNPVVLCSVGLVPLTSILNSMYSGPPSVLLMCAERNRISSTNTAPNVSVANRPTGGMLCPNNDSVNPVVLSASVARLFITMLPSAILHRYNMSSLIAIASCSLGAVSVGTYEVALVSSLNLYRVISFRAV